MTNRFKGQGLVVIGGQWGDEGKGRIVDTLAEDCDVIVRFQGGNNAGHSLHIGKKSLVLHLIPCGIMRDGKVCVIGNGVVIDPEILFREIELLKTHGIDCSPTNLRIAKNAHIIFPFHKLIDEQREKTTSFIGTTKRGIGPCYEDKVARFGIMAKDLLSKDLLEKKLRNVFMNRHFNDADNRESQQLSFDEIFIAGCRYGEKLKPFLCDTGELIYSFLENTKRVLFEGAQGTLLDVDHGTYPFVTSSNCVAAQASIGAGIGMAYLNEILMVSKAYCTRVGEGPFFTEGSDEEQERFRKKGHEFGATTGRPRRCGWLDLPALKYAARLNGATGLVLTKVDVLAGFGPIKVATSYSYNNANSLTFLDAMDLYSVGKKFDIDYIELPEITSMPDKIHGLSSLPKSLRDLCAMIEKELSIPIYMISYGQKRGQEVFLTT